jgi:hypothetical protein
MCDYCDPNYIVYESEVEELCDVCGGCDNVRSCSQGQEVMACNRATLEVRNLIRRIV